MSRNEVKVAEAPRNDRPADKYRCGRLCNGGGMGNCPRGPRPTGDCGADSDPCKPARTFRDLRRRSIFALTLFGILVIAVWSAIDSSRFYKPGDLSKPHAVIFNTQTGESHCAACHPNAATSINDWFRVDDMFHHRLAQTDSCVACHHVKMPADVARSPHNLSAQRLTEIRTAWAQTASSDEINDTIWSSEVRKVASANLSNKSLDSFDSIQCASCHREHGGTNAIMTAMSNAQCQSCHSRTFESFRDGHPEWQQWPHVGAKVIVFDHATHQRLHYPKASPKSDNGSEDEAADAAASPSDRLEDSSFAGGRTFDCRTCHPGASSSDDSSIALTSFGGASDREPLRTVSFEVACADCHSAGLKQQANERLDLFALPTLTSGPAAELGPWPEAATGFFDGEIGPLTQWLINDGQQVEKALSRLPGAASFTQIDPTRVEQVRAAVVVADSIRRAMDRFSSQGSNVVLGRDVLGRSQERSATAMRQLLRTVPPQLVSDARRQWFDSVAATAAFDQPLFKNAFPISARPFFGADGQYAQSPVIASAQTDDLLEDDLLMESGGDNDSLTSDDEILAAGDPLDSDPLSVDPLDEPAGEVVSPTRDGDRFDPQTALPDGGWYRDDLRLAISYRGSGHADPVLKAAVELASSLPASDPVRIGLLSSSAVSSCVQCHVGAMQSSVSIWQTPVGRSESKALTKFSHKPHFNLPQLSDCTHCHMTDADAASIDEIVKLKSTPGYDPTASHGFISIGKSACVSCHTQGAAGDNCTQCHHYHSHK